MHADSAVRARRYALGLLVVVYTFNFVDRQILAILLPAIQAEFGVGDTVLGFLAGTAFALFYATLGVPIALLADRWNRRNLIAISLALWSGMTALSGAAANVLQLALARIGVGIGEAGCSPAAHSMIADYYPPEQRSSAMGIYTLGISFGIMLAFFTGGWVVENLGWRQAFLIVGLPGIVLALLFRFTVKEPKRGLSEQRSDSGTHPGILEVARFLAARRSFLFISLGAAMASFAGYAVTNFFPSFLIRSHGMTPTEIGIYLGLALGLAGGLGFAGGGFLADRLARKGHDYALLGVACAMALATLLVATVFLADDRFVVMAVFAVAAVVSNLYLATTFAQTQGLVGLRMRGVASALMLFIINIVGLGLGPQTAGIVSDLLRESVGEQSMRYALLIVAGGAYPLSGLCYFVASRSIVTDLSRAAES